MEETDHVVRDFLVESYENLDGVENQLVSLEDADGDPQTVAAIFRAIHTIKGTCGFLGFGRLEQVAHVGENLLSKLRDGVLKADADIVSALLEMVDAIREILGRIEESGSEGEAEYAELRERLEFLARGSAAEAAKVETVATDPASGPLSAGRDAADSAVESGDAPAGEVPRAIPAEPAVEAAVAVPQSEASRSGLKRDSIGDLLVRRGYASRAQIDDALLAQTVGDPRHLGEILVERGVLTSSQLVEVLKSQQEARGAVADNSIRVQVELLDRLMNLVGELVLARNQVLQFEAAESQGVAFHRTAQRLSLITSELQEGVMQTRMQPIGTIWDKLPRVVRDLSRSTGKTVSVEMDGRDTELDKTIIEAIKDPLTHIIRNAVDHGIELPAIRAERGKDPEGRLVLRAFHEGGRVNIEIRDDGGGIDVGRIRAKAIEKGILTAERADLMSEQELTQLIFAPGFSTAQQITNVSGRGVGMDVVKTNIERIGGTIELSGKLGRGTTIRIKIPLTLAIIPALIVRCEQERYAIPQVSLVELVRVDLEEDPRGIEYVHGTPVHRLRGDLLPLVFLGEALKIRDRGERDPRASADAGVINIVVVQAERDQFGLVVDDVTDTQEIVVKPLGKQLKSLECFAGATIMGDGRVALILDVQGMARHSGIQRDSAKAKAISRRAEQVSAQSADQLLLFSVGDRERMAIPLSSVRRLEEFEQSALEHAGKLEVVQYRGGLLPLVDLRERFGRGPVAASGPAPVIVYGQSDESVGFVVQEIIDVVDQDVCVEDCSKEPGIRGSAVIQGRVTDLLDPDAMTALVRVRGEQGEPESWV